MTIERIRDHSTQILSDLDEVKYFLVGAFAYVFVASFYEPIKLELDKNKLTETLKDLLIVIAAGAAGWLLATKVPISGVDSIYLAILAGAAIAIIRFGSKNK